MHKIQPVYEVNGETFQFRPKSLTSTMSSQTLACFIAKTFLLSLLMTSRPSLQPLGTEIFSSFNLTQDSINISKQTNG